MTSAGAASASLSITSSLVMLRSTFRLLFVRPDGGQLGEIGELLQAGSIRPVIDKTFPFDQAQEALAYLEQGRAKGKVVVQLK